MRLVKLGEATIISASAADAQTAELVLSDSEILRDFQKTASELKAIAPKAKDFLYFSAIMMHAAEASLLDGAGIFKKDASGNDVTAVWEKTGDSWVWKCSDANIKPYKNSNNDIFPEEELIKAYKKWVGRPLCLDHKSSSVDMIRGLIIDTYYDRPNKRVVALCALDKVNYADLARKVATGYATSVSMGTAVGRAICFDCGNVARVESDFCNHMRNKSCYGEINVDLNPIELSIVVNGADPKAKIRHIVASAAADNIARYIEVKQQELSKVAEQSQPIDEEEHVQMAKNIGDGLEGIANKIDNLKEEVDELRRGEQAEIDQEYHKTPDKQDAKDQTVSAEVTRLANAVEKIQANFQKLQQDLHKLYHKQGEDNNMSSKKTAWFQGTEEPTPGKPRYPKEDSDSIRNNQDKQMESPQDVGSTEGLFPGDEQKKKELNRLAAEQEARALRRQAALQKAQEQTRKEAYLNGTEEPTPGKPRYPKEDSDKIRDKEDKQMGGPSPFPGVGKIDGLYGDDMKKKEMLSRAKLTAKFVKAANPNGSDNQSESRWQVFADNKLILSATVENISGGRVDALYDMIATPEFGKKILAKIRTEGFDKAASAFKGAQAAPVAAPAPAMDPGAAPSMEMGGEGLAEGPVDGGGSGDPKEDLPKLLDTAENTLADIRAGINALTNDSGNNLADFDQLAGPAGDAGGLPVAASAAVVQKKLTHSLTLGMKQAARELESHVEELRLAQSIYDNKSKIKKSDAAFVGDLVQEACEDAKQTIADCYRLMDAFVKYAKGTEILVKHAAKKREFMKSAQVTGLPGDPLDPKLVSAPKAKVVTPAPAPKPAPVQKSPSDMSLDELIKQRGGTPGTDLIAPSVPQQMKAPKGKQVLSPPKGTMNVSPQAPQMGKADDMSYAMDEEHDHQVEEDCGDACDSNDAVKVDKDGTMTADKPEEAGKAMKAMKEAAFDLSSKAGRAQLRAKLAEKGQAFSDMLGKAHSGGVTTQLDVKPTGDLAKVETLEETHKAMMDLATAPPKVRKMAEDIQRLVVAGKIDPDSDFPSLISQGLDGDAVKYWKSYYGQAKDGGSQFASELVQENKARKMAAEKEIYQVKIARAYELAYEMSRKGLIGNDRSALNQQVSELMSFNDDGFESMKRYVDRSPMSKQASALPQVGMIGMGTEVVIPAPEAAGSDLVSDYGKLFANRRY